MTAPLAAKKSTRRATRLDMVVGNNVRIWRLAKGLSQVRLASRLGITFQQVQKYEVGANRIGTGRLVKIAAILGVPVSRLVEGADEGAPIPGVTTLMNDSRSFRLASAFAAIPEENHCRLSLVNLVEQIAAHVPQRPRRGKHKKRATG